MKLVKLIKDAKKKEIEKKVKAAKKIAVATSVGSAVGAVTGLLFAPKAGKETRKDIADNVKAASESVSEKVKCSGEKLRKKTATVHKEFKGTLANINHFISKIKTREEIREEQGEKDVNEE